MEATPLVNQPISAQPNYPVDYKRHTHRISLPYLNRTIMVSVDDIVCLQGEGNYTFLCTRDRKRYLVSKTLKAFSKSLNETMFVRIHKSSIVNLAYVQYGGLKENRSVRLIDGRDIVVSRRRLREIIQQLNRYQLALIS